MLFFTKKLLISSTSLLSIVRSIVSSGVDPLIEYVDNLELIQSQRNIAKQEKMFLAYQKALQAFDYETLTKAQQLDYILELYHNKIDRDERHEIQKLAVIAPNLPCKPNTMMFNKVTIKGAEQAVQMFGPAQAAVAKAVADSVEDGTIPADEADDVFVCVGVFIM